MHASVRVLFSALLLSAATPSLHAQTPDYGRGFERLDALGLPNATGARYVNLSQFYMQDSGHGQYFMDHEIKFAGNAWLLEEEESGRARIIVGQSRVMEVWDQNRLQKLQREEAKATTGAAARTSVRFMQGQDEQGRVGGRWKNADPLRDAAKAMAWLDKQAQDEQRQQNWYLREDGYGRLFLFAAHLYRAGHTNEANQLVAKLFEHAGAGQRVLVQAVGLLADSQYAAAYGEFKRTGDWAAFGESLRALLARFTSGWKRRGAVDLLEKAVARRVQGETAPAVSGDGLTDEDRELALALDSPNPGGRQWSHRALWIFPEDEKQRSFWVMAGADDALSRIRARGMQSLPLLIALLDQDFLIAQPVEDVRRGTHTTHSSTMSEEEKNAQEFRNMNRPATRAEVARLLLQSLLPAGDRTTRWRQRELEEVAAEVRAWFAANRERPLHDIAMDYLEQGDDSQKREALDYLLTALPPERASELEAHLINEDDPDNTLDRLRRYAEARGAAAKPIVEPFIAKLEAGELTPRHSEGMPDSYLQQRQRQQSNHIERIRQAISSESLEDTLDAIAKGEHPVEKVPVLLDGRMQRESLARAVDALVNAAASSSDAAIRQALLSRLGAHQRIQALSHHMLMPDGSAEPWAQSILKEFDDLKLAATTEAWRTLLADDREVPVSLAMALRISDQAAVLFEMLYDEQHAKGVHVMLGRLGRTGYALLRERALAKLDGRESRPEYPSLSALPDEARAGLAAQLIDTPEADRVARVSGLSALELLSLVEDAPTNHALNAALIPAANRIRAVEFVGSMENPVELEALRGGTLDRAVIDRLIAFALAEEAAGRAPTIAVIREPAAAGVVIRIFSESPLAASMQGAVSSAAMLGIFGQEGAPVTAVAYVPGGPRVMGSWGERVVEPPAGAATAGAEEVDEDALSLLDELVSTTSAKATPKDETRRNEEFWKRMESIGNPDVSSVAAAAVHIIVTKPNTTPSE